jgi:predicted DNA-binding ribbon-helix-helix protein
VVLAHGEARNFASLLRCCCLIYLDRGESGEGRRFAVPEREPRLVAAE